MFLYKFQLRGPWQFCSFTHTSWSTAEKQNLSPSPKTSFSNRVDSTHRSPTQTRGYRVDKASNPVPLCWLHSVSTGDTQYPFYPVRNDTGCAEDNPNNLVLVHLKCECPLLRTGKALAQSHWRHLHHCCAFLSQSSRSLLCYLLNNHWCCVRVPCKMSLRCSNYLY